MVKATTSLTWEVVITVGGLDMLVDRVYWLLGATGFYMNCWCTCSHSCISLAIFKFAKPRHCWVARIIPIFLDELIQLALEVGIASVVCHDG